LTVEIKSLTGSCIRDIDIKAFTSTIPFKKALGELLVFNGHDTELEGVKALLLKESFPRIQGITYTGFVHKNNQWLFATQDRIIDSSMNQVDSMAVSTYGGKTDLLKAETMQKGELLELFDSLFSFNKLGIAGTVIGWTASLFIREKLWKAGRIKHPHLLIIGEAGSGKSETAENIIMPILGMDGQPASAGQITRFSAMKNAAASNFVPYVIGEYKPQKLPDWIVREISELLRNSYDRQEGQRGTTEQVLINYPYRTPIMLLGEGSPAHETAVKERSMQLILSKKDSKPHAEGFLKLKCNRKLLEKFGFLLLKTALFIDENKLIEWHKAYYNKLSSVYDERIRSGIAVVCTGLSLVSRAFKNENISMSLDKILNKTIEQLKADIYEGQEPKSDVINTLEFFDRLADIGVLIDGVHYKKIRDTDELALCANRCFERAKEHCAKTKTELQSQRDFMTQVRRSDFFIDNDRAVRLFDIGSTTSKSIKCLIIDLKKLKANIPTFSGTLQEESNDKSEKSEAENGYDDIDDYIKHNPFIM